MRRVASLHLGIIDRPGDGKRARDRYVRDTLPMRRLNPLRSRVVVVCRDDDVAVSPLKIPCSPLFSFLPSFSTPLRKTENCTLYHDARGKRVSPFRNVADVAGGIEYRGVS